MTDTATRTAQTTTERALDLLIGLCESHNLPVKYQAESEWGSLVFDDKIVLPSNATADKRLNILLNLLSEFEFSKGGKCHHHKGNEINSFARFAKKLIVGIIDEIEVF